MIKKSLIAVILLLMILFCLPGCSSSSTSSLAQALPEEAKTDSEGSYSYREEVIYSTLALSGEVEQIYTVNILNITEAGMLTDYGSYSSVKNLTSVDELNLMNDQVIINAMPGRFYYQGNMTDKNLPWNISIRYELNGSPIEADLLAGQSGHLKIVLTTGQNRNVDSVFFKHYLLQVVFSLDTDKCTNILAEGAALANSGTDKLITFTVMPGKEARLTVDAYVTDFEMKQISFSAVPFSLNIDLPDASALTEDFSLLTEATGQLKDGISSLSEGADKLNTGMERVKDGSSEFLAGLNELDEKSRELVTASEQISEGLSELSTGFQSISGVLGQAAASLPDVQIPEDELAKLIQNNPDNDALRKLLEAYGAAQAIKEALQDPSLAMAITGLSSGISGLNDNYSQFHSGLITYTGGVSQAASSYNLLDSAVSDLAAGAGDLTEGLKAVQDGAAELDTQAAKVPAMIQSSMDNLLSEYDASDFTPVSFTSARNDRVTFVQFIFRTEDIKKEEAPETPASKEEADGFWARLKKLFIR